MLANPTTPAASLPINSRTVFVDINTVRISRGIRGDKVKELVDAGKLLWVFDLAHPQANNRHLRFWIEEIQNPSGVAHLKLNDVLSKILPTTRRTINGSEMGLWLLVDRSTVKRIGAECRGTITNKRFLTVKREVLAGYLSRRWLGADVCNGKAKTA